LNRHKKKKARLLIKQLSNLFGLRLEITASERGRRLESYCARKCRSLGFQVIDHSSNGKPWDLMINGYRVQCKSRKKHGHNSHGVNLFKNSQKRYTVREVDFFVIRFNRHCYVIPAACIADRQGLVRSWVCLTNMRHYINAWNQLEGVSVAFDRQTSLFA
jgi:hypothetical protein